jgi:hypothetical protein
MGEIMPVSGKYPLITTNFLSIVFYMSASLFITSC